MIVELVRAETMPLESLGVLVMVAVALEAVVLTVAVGVYSSVGGAVQ